MLAANHYVIRYATNHDERALQRLMELDSARLFCGPALIGEIDGAPAAAMSLADGRVIADPFQSTGTLRQLLRMRAGALRAHWRTPSLPERLRSSVRMRPAPAHSATKA